MSSKINSNNRLYLDNAATTKPCLEVENICPSTGWENPAAQYDSALTIHTMLKEAKSKLATALHCPSINVMFTSGGTEANASAIFSGLCSRSKMNQGQTNPSQVYYSAGDHSSIQETFKWPFGSLSFI